MMGRPPGYANFHDPLGLVARMLRSRDPAARSALLRAAAEVVLKPVDLALQPTERRRLAQARPSAMPIILIVGAPRSGTTLVYQTLAQHLPVTYFDNLSALFPRSPITARGLLDRFLVRPRDDAHSYYGNTAGLSGPNDGFHVWNRWLGSDRYCAPQDIPATSKREMRRFFDAWLTSFGRPLLNKNNRNTDCMPLLASALEHSWFVVVRRDPVFVVQSLLVARQRIQGSKAIGWGLNSRDQDPARGPQGYIDDVCEQVVGIDAKLARSAEQIGAERVIEVSYERFCEDPLRVVQEVRRRIWGTSPRDESLRPRLGSFRNTNAVVLEPDEFARIKARIAELHGGDGMNDACRAAGR